MAEKKAPKPAKKKKVVKKKLPPLRARARRRIIKRDWAFAEKFTDMIKGNANAWGEALRFLRGEPKEGLHAYSILINEKGREHVPWKYQLRMQICDIASDPRLEVRYKGFINRFPLKDFGSSFGHLVEKKHKDVITGGHYYPVLPVDGHIVNALKENGWGIGMRLMNYGDLKGKIEAEITLPKNEYMLFTKPIKELFFNNATQFKMSLLMKPTERERDLEISRNIDRYVTVEKYAKDVHYNIYRAMKTAFETDGLAFMQQNDLSPEEKSTVKDAFKRNMPAYFSEFKNWHLMREVYNVMKKYTGLRTKSRKKSMEYITSFLKSDEHVQNLARREGAIETDAKKWLDLIEKTLLDGEKRDYEYYMRRKARR